MLDAIATALGWAALFIRRFDRALDYYFKHRFAWRLSWWKAGNQ